MNTYKAGLFAEWVARWFLRFHGFKILESRYITGRGTGRAEIDIIAMRGDLVLFVEVKNRKNAALGIEAVPSVQHARLRAAAEEYLRRRRHIGLARFDIIVVRGLKVAWIKNGV